jgi:hypothetical protein
MLGLGANTFEEFKTKNDRLFDQSYALLRKQMRFTKMLMDKRKPSKYTWEEVKKNALHPSQIWLVYQTVANLKVTHENVLMEAATEQDFQINFIMQVLDEPPEPKKIGGNDE